MEIRLELNWHDKWIGVYDEEKFTLSTGDMTITAGKCIMIL